MNEGLRDRDKGSIIWLVADHYPVITEDVRHVSMKRELLLIASDQDFSAALPLALVLLAIQAHAQTLPEAKCTGKPDVPWSEQIAGCSKAIESGTYTGKDLAKAFTSRGNAYAQTSDIDRSLADFDQAIRLDPNDAFAVGARGDLHLVRKDYAQAITDYTTAISIEPNNAPALTGRAIVYVVTRDPDRAIADCDQAIHLQPTFAAALYWRGMAKRLKGELRGWRGRYCCCKEDRSGGRSLDWEARNSCAGVQSPPSSLTNTRCMN